MPARTVQAVQRRDCRSPLILDFWLAFRSRRKRLHSSSLVSMEYLSLHVSIASMGGSRALTSSWVRALPKPVPIAGVLARSWGSGCLSAYLSEPALAVEIGRMSGKPVASFDDILARGAAGEPIVLGVLDQAGEILGSAVSSLINIFNPPLVVLGGDMSRAEAFLRPPFERALRPPSHPSIFSQ